MHILVTGCTGFAGGFLVEELFAAGSRVIFGISRDPERTSALPHLQGKLARLFPCNLGDRGAIEQVLAEIEPAQIYHLAGYAHVGRSFQESDLAWEANLTATRNLCAAVLRRQNRPRILWVGSALVYGEPTSPDQLITEEHPLRPLSPYAASKAAADLAMFQYALGYGLDIVRVRPFNHIGPRQSPAFAVSHFAEQIAAIERGKQPPLLQTGDLRPSRDLTDVRDMVRGYRLLMEMGNRGDVYNIGTGEAHSIQQILDRLLAMTTAKVEVRQESQLLRARDTPALRADAGKLRRLTGWTPRYSLDQTLRDILDSWRSARSPRGA